MRLTLDYGAGKTLSSKDIENLDKALRTKIKGLVGWSYSSVTGELILDSGDSEDEVLSAKIEDSCKKTECFKKLRLELMEMVKEWEG